MEFSIITLFPEVLKSYFSASIAGRAAHKKLIKIKLANLRDFAKDTRKTVDGRPYGGGVGMIIRPDVAISALEAARKKIAKPAKIILLTPQGTTFNQKIAKDLAKFSGLIILSGRYEGTDERVEKFVDLQISIGDFILTGGELPAAIICDSVLRLIPGVLPKVEAQGESFENNLLAAPVYTKPATFRGLQVPKILLTGKLAEIKGWRKRQRILLTAKLRPDLFEKYLKEASSD